MNYFKFFLLAFLLAFLSLVYGQEYFYADDNPEIVRKRSSEDYIEERDGEGIGQNSRYRRDDESSRHRRQGGHGNGGHEGITGPVHTFVKTDEHAHFKWGVRHHVGHEYAGRR